MSSARWKTAGVWFLQLLMAFIFFNAGRAKIWGQGWENRFRAWGYPDGFYLVVSCLEMLGGLAVLIPKTAAYGASALIVVMLGAIGHHLWRGEFSRLIQVFLFIVFLATIARRYWPDFMVRRLRQKSSTLPNDK